jgi:hypothetical protein
VVQFTMWTVGAASINNKSTCLLAANVQTARRSQQPFLPVLECAASG